MPARCGRLSLHRALQAHDAFRRRQRSLLAQEAASGFLSKPEPDATLAASSQGPGRGVQESELEAVPLNVVPVESDQTPDRCPKPSGVSPFE